MSEGIGVSVQGFLPLLELADRYYGLSCDCLLVLLEGGQCPDEVLDTLVDRPVEIQH